MGFLTSLVNRSKYYNQLRYSPIPDRLFEAWTGQLKKNIALYQSILPPDQWKDQWVFDIGANKGNKTRAFLDLGAKVLSVEPERKSLETLRYRFGKNGRVEILAKGVSDTPGEVRLFVKDYRSGYNTLSEKWKQEGQQSKEVLESYLVPVTTMTELIKTYGKPLFVKIDVEGFELAVLKGLNQPVPYLIFEANLPEFREETHAIIHHINTVYQSRFSINFVIKETLMKEWVSMEQALTMVDHFDYHGVEILIRED